jgi:hypothetical protein
MFMHYQFISAAIGVVIGLLILGLIRKNHLHSGYAVWWLCVAAAIMVLGGFPELVDSAGRILGVAYPPILLIVLGVCIVLLKILTMDIERTRQEQQLRRLAQRLAMLEEKKGK